MITADYHVHTSFSGDSESSPESMIREAIRRGLKTICITDHEDKGFVCDGILFEIDTVRYFQELRELQEKYRKEIDIKIGVETGLEVHRADQYHKFVRENPFDFVIGSLHLVDGQDPYDRVIFEGKKDQDVYLRTLEATLENIRQTDDYDVLGHIDYVVRYGREAEKSYQPSDMKDLIDEILKHLISHGKGLELNTAGLKYGLPFAHPHDFILTRYKELGGEIITIGSDAHKPIHLAYDFEKAKEILVRHNFTFYTVYSKREPKNIHFI
ncbi:MAG: histidinol-phosphatase HisJ family protein [Dorea sp.]|nr:histidinol-phosphatase HisJ family protein [Dorea sp.]